MATYYVRKGGNDANTGLSNALAGGGGATGAWLTIGKAILAGGMASGDTVYIGAGIYRESLTVGITPTVTTQIIGDYDGTKTGDPGEVRWTAYTTNDTSAPAAFTCKLNGKNFLSFSNIHFVGGSGAPCCVDGNTASTHDGTFTRCAFSIGSAVNQGTGCIQLQAPADAAANYMFDSCIFGYPGKGITVGGLTSATADYDLNVTIKNCVFLGNATAIACGQSAATFKAGGISIYNCSMSGGLVSSTAGQSLIYPVLVSNCWIQADGGTALNASGGGNGSIVEDYNQFWAQNARSNISIGPFSQATGNYSRLVSYGQEPIWGGQLRPFLTPLSGSPLLGFGNVRLTTGRAATMTDDATVGTIAWTTPANASVPDGTSTTATSIPITSGKSHYLNAQSFTGFAGIPSDATIKSIRVELIVAAASATAVKCNSVKLLKAGVITGNDLASSNTTQFTVAATIQSWGSAADPLWGTTWTVAQVQAAGFGCVWSATNTSGSTVTCTVDFIRVIVAYTTADGAGGVATDMLGNPRPAGGNSTAYAVGALERGNTGTMVTTPVHTGGGSAVKITGPGYHDFYANVDAASVVIGVWLRYDTAGQQPTVTLLAAPELGIAANVALTWSDPGANVYAQFTTTAVPTAAGVVVIRVATAAQTGFCYADDFSFT